MMGYGVQEIMSNIAVLAAIGLISAVLSVLILRENGGMRDAQYNKAKTVRA